MNYDVLLLLPTVGAFGFLYWDIFTYDWDWHERPVEEDILGDQK